MTFTEAAAAELAARVREGLEYGARTSSDRRGRAREAAGARSRASTAPRSRRSTRSRRTCCASAPSRRAWTRSSTVLDHARGAA